jgi:hypothetical protein
MPLRGGYGLTANGVVVGDHAKVDYCPAFLRPLLALPLAGETDPTTAVTLPKHSQGNTTDTTNNFTHFNPEGAKIKNDINNWEQK